MNEKTRSRFRSLGTRSYRVAEISRLLRISSSSLYVLLTRWVKEGSLKRLASGIYALPDVNLDLEKEALRLYAPAYLSFETVLARAGWLNLLPYATTWATTRKTRTIVLAEREFVFRQLQKDLFFGYQTQGGIPTAAPAKALVDLAYLVDLGRDRWPQGDLHIPKEGYKSLSSILKSLKKSQRIRVERALNGVRMNPVSERAAS